MAVSRDEQRIAVALGKVEFGADETITCLIVYEFKKLDKSSMKKTKKSDARMRKFGVKLEEIYRKETKFSADTSIEFVLIVRKNILDEIDKRKLLTIKHFDLLNTEFNPKCSHFLACLNVD